MALEISLSTILFLIVNLGVLYIIAEYISYQRKRKRGRRPRINFIRALIVLAIVAFVAGIVWGLERGIISF